MNGNFRLVEVKGDLFSAPSSASLAHCISRDCRLGAGIAKLFRQRFGRVDEIAGCGADVGGLAPLKVGNRFVYNLVTKEKYFHKPTYESLRGSLEATRSHALVHDVTLICMPRIGCGLDKLEWPKVVDVLRDVFGESDIEIRVYSI